MSPAPLAVSAIYISIVGVDVVPPYYKVKYTAERMLEASGLGVTIRVPDMGGPETHTLPDLVRTHLAYRGSRRPVLPVPLAGKAYAAFRRGGNLAPSHAVGKGTFEEFLAAAGRRG
ncbi:hypothetical protein [Streptomyces sp. AP-93]|uniref:hypothetical protein n=1 Tax=Streptomyces sp. AP-93 TaxID=2929048 RepID=UPI0027E5B12E|nr:hypothetical protein [Streptomyces sp. AP-93]